jgi:T3SS negative regulator,GrlR
MQNGLYAAEFQTPLGKGNGVAMLLNGTLHGGDSMIYYQGNYTIEGNSFKAVVKTGAHAHPPGMTSVFGRDQVTINLVGTIAGDTLTASGKAAEVPNVNFSAKLQLIAVGA